MQQQSRRSSGARRNPQPKHPQWYLISEDRSLSLRLVSGAILCEGEDGALVVSPEEAAHAARFDIIDDALWLSCIRGRVRADGRLVTQHRRVESGVHLHIGLTRYFVADALNDPMPYIPVLENRLEPGDTRLPKPGGRRFPVFYDSPLEVEEILITEAAEPLPDKASGESDPAEDQAAERAAATGTSQTPSAVSKPVPAAGPRTGGPGRTRMTALLLAGLAAAAGYGVHEWSGHRTLATILESAAEAVDVAVTTAPTHEDAQAKAGHGFDLVGLDLAHLAWADEISRENHDHLLAIAGSLGDHLRSDTVRESIEHYGNRLLRIDDPRTLEPLVLSLGGLVAGRGEYRAMLAALEGRVIELSRTQQQIGSEGDAGLRAGRGSINVAADHRNPDLGLLPSIAAGLAKSDAGR